MNRSFSVMLALLSSLSVLMAAPEGFNYEEAKVPPYTVPDPLRRADGRVISKAVEWTGGLREETRKLLEQEMFGRAPARPSLWYRVVEEAVAMPGGGE